MKYLNKTYIEIVFTLLCKLSPLQTSLSFSPNVFIVQENKEKFNELKKCESSLREEIIFSQKKIKEDKQSHNMKLDAVKSELQRYKVRYLLGIS